MGMPNFSKILFPVLCSIFLDDQKAPGQHQSQTLKSEVTQIFLKAFVGLILVLAIVLGMIRIGLNLQSYFDQLENGLTYSVATFGSFTILCSLGLYMLFREKAAKTEDEVLAPQVVPKEELLLRFAEGFNDALLTSSKHPESNSPESANQSV